ncbi:MAG: acetyltransferase [Reyranella sp.]|uniref:GNAT family N-acetyltransferase n=1 Tax=Reyranella sp. TaxID=1929291 RepID=UPI001ACEBE73|nr:GNAT family N-acetyltransferase [Reyranella sp.]MBN9090618.1 acetyltransferase [Reyranella sp.]
MVAYTFTRLAAAALPLVHEWLSRPHVVEWWPEPEMQAAQIDDHVEGDDTTPYLVSLDGRPFAYLQCAQLSDDTLCLDQFIADAALLGRGHGSGFIRQFCDEQFASPEIKSITTDPAPDNARAIRAYEKAGFRRVGLQATPWGRVLLMQRDKPS